VNEAMLKSNSKIRESVIIMNEKSPKHVKNLLWCFKWRCGNEGT